MAVAIKQEQKNKQTKKVRSRETVARKTGNAETIGHTRAQRNGEHMDLDTLAVNRLQVKHVKVLKKKELTDIKETEAVVNRK